MPIAEIATGLASAKTLASLLKGAKDVIDSVKFSEIVIEAQQVILSLQESLLETQEKMDALVKAKADVEAYLVNRDEWRERAKHYSLVEVRSGLCAYKFNPEAEDNPTPVHWACPKCFASHNLRQYAENSSCSVFGGWASLRYEQAILVRLGEGDGETGDLSLHFESGGSEVCVG